MGSHYAWPTKVISVYSPASGPPQWPTAVQAGVQADNRSVSLSWEPPLEKPNQLVENYRVSVRLDGHTVQEVTLHNIRHWVRQDGRTVQEVTLQHKTLG